MKSPACRWPRAAIPLRAAVPRHRRRRRPETPSGSLARQIQCRVIQLPDLARTGPAFMRGRVSSRNSQARARLQSRLTVATDTSSTCAASSRLSPPKKRSSTTRLWRASQRLEALQRVVERHEIDALRRPARCAASDSETCSWPLPALRPAARPRHVDQDAAHDLRRHGEEVRAVLPAHVLPVHQPQVGLVDERRRLEDVARAARRPCSGRPGDAAPAGPAASGPRGRPGRRRSTRRAAA